MTTISIRHSQKTDVVKTYNSCVVFSLEVDIIFANRRNCQAVSRSDKPVSAYDISLRHVIARALNLIQNKNQVGNNSE